ncbi:unnamed protein product [Peniophora sp. CBMAI 1063]|nr:unnamed protein product [Peniophora sp. CBMAI 1063]
MSECRQKLTNGSFGQDAHSAGALDSNGQYVLDVKSATAITYDKCNTECSKLQSPWHTIDWSQFLTNISSWLVPWLALLSQLPYGATVGAENVMALLLALGSPILAVYSLVLTALNRRHLARTLSRIEYPKLDRVYTILDKLQQAPLCVDTRGAISQRLDVFPLDDEVWDRLQTLGLDVHTWTTVAAFQMAWVIFAYVLTVLVTFLSTNSTSSYTTGGDIGTVFLWTLPVVIGWLQVSPISSSTRLRESVKELMHVSDGRDMQHPALFLDYTDHLALRDMQATPPIFNYSRFKSWSHCVDLVLVVLRRAAHDAPHRTSAGSTFHRQGDSESNCGAEQGQDKWRIVEMPETKISTGFPRRLIYASMMALLIQWGTSGAAILTSMYQLPRGLGCHSGPWLMYASASTFIWVVMVLSTVIDSVALQVFLSCSGKMLAIANAIFVIAMSVLNALGVDQTCYCGSARPFLGSRAYMVLVPTSQETSAHNAFWAGAVALSAIVVVLFVVILNVILRDADLLAADMGRTRSRPVRRDWNPFMGLAQPSTSVPLTAPESGIPTDIPLLAFGAPQPSWVDYQTTGIAH